jgi:hypothetical protein
VEEAAAGFRALKGSLLLLSQWMGVTREQNIHGEGCNSQYKPNFLPTISPFDEAELVSYLGLLLDELRCNSGMANSECILQNLAS